MYLILIFLGCLFGLILFIPIIIIEHFKGDKK